MVKSGFSSAPIIIDGKAHMMGRLASNVAKLILQGEKIVVVRCEDINISGGFYRNKLKYLDFLKKRCNVKPTRGPFHFRAPSHIFYRCVRGMVPHKSTKGKKALANLKLYEGMPSPFDKMKKKCIANSLRVLRLRHGRKYCNIGRLAHEVGWKHQDIVATLEDRRRIKAMEYYKRKMAIEAVKKEVLEDPKIAAQIAPLMEVIHQYGYK
jgi:large subunit ribosomal protein L13Ae